MDTLCVWGPSDSDPSVEQCSFNPNIGGTFISTMIMTTIITTIALPFDKFFMWMVEEVRDFASSRMAKKLRMSSILVLDDDENTTHELMELQTLKSTLLRGARLDILKAHADDLSVEDEVKFLLTNRKELEMADTVRKAGGVFGLELLVDDENGDPIVAAEALRHAAERDPKVLHRRLKKARKRADVIKEGIEALTSDLSRDMFLLQHFLVDSLKSFRRRIAYRFYFSNFENELRKDSIYIRYLCVFLLPAYVFVATFYIFLFGVGIGAGATNLWLLGCSVSFKTYSSCNLSASG
jgi:hypothetical protein